MANSRSEKRKVEDYARTLLNAAKLEGRANADLVQWRHAVKFSPEVLGVLTQLQAEDDVALASKVYAQLRDLVAADDVTVLVTATTAVEMDDELREKVVIKAHEMFHAPIYLAERIDPNILGGIVIEAMGKRYDASVRTQLASVRTTLSSTFTGGAV